MDRFTWRKRIRNYWLTNRITHAQDIESNRIGNILDAALNSEAASNNYLNLVSNLLEWIEEQIKKLYSRDFANNLEGVKAQLEEFGHYRLDEKPPKFDEKGLGTPFIADNVK